MSGDDSKPSVVVESVMRAFHLLDQFGPGRPEMSLAEMVQQTGYSKTTVFRLLRTIEHAGWLEKTANGAFRLTTKPFQLGSVLVNSLDLHAEAREALVDLAVKFGGSAFLMVPSGTNAVCLDRVDRGSVRVMSVDIGGVIPLHLGAAARTLLAFNEEELLPPLIARGLDRRTNDSIINVAALKADLALSRQRGYTVSIEDVTPHIGACGAPVFDRSGRAIAAISLGGLVERYLPPRLEEVAGGIVSAAQQLSARLGYASRN